MISSATTKVLFFIALSLGPKDAKEIVATSNSENYSWSYRENGWFLKTKGLPNENWVAKGPQPASDQDWDMSRIAHHSWGPNSSLDLTDGSRIEKQGETGFYIIDPGAPNKKVFTILYSRK
jgi:hypothetical protein